MATEFIKRFKKKSSERQELLNQHDFETIADAIVENSKEEIAFLIWTSCFQLINDDLLLFEIVKSVLPRLNRDELQLKQLSDFYSRLNIELSRSTRSHGFVLKVAFLCEDYIVVSDQRAIFWKEILPVAMTILMKLNQVIYYEGQTELGRKYAQELIDRILKKPPPTTTLTAFVSMFKDIELTPQQHDTLITKASESLHKVHHQDIGNLALSVFQTALFNQLLVPIMSLDKYFYKHRYRKEINESGMMGVSSSCDVDSIDDTADEGVIESEEIVIYHFQNIAEYTTIERDLTNSIKPLEYAPKFILSPFIATLLVSIAKISSGVEGNFRLNQSTILPLLKQIFRFNEEHKEILRTSGWASSIDGANEIVNTDILLKMLQQNTCGLKQNIALNGLFGLSFLLLKTKASSTLNKFAIDFLNEIIKKRQEFTSDILKIVIKMLYCEKNKTPIIQCLSTILQNRYLDINATQDAMQKLIEDLTELDIDTALAIESVIFTVITKSIALRDIMIEVMKSAMYQRNVEVRKMAIFSFCVMLRKFTRNPRTSTPLPHMTQHHMNETSSRYSHNISFFSLTQTQISIKNVNSNVRQVEIMMLEILGVLRRCFSETRELKVMLYESLLSSIMANTFIVSNVLEFIEGHFRDYFDVDSDDSNTDVLINFEKTFKITANNNVVTVNGESVEANVVVMDDLGCLLKFIINCVIIAEKHRENINCDLNLYKRVIEKLIERVLNSKLSHLEIENEVVEKKHGVIIPQFLNCIEALMIYCLHENQVKNDENSIEKIAQLFEKHKKVRERIKKMQDSGNSNAAGGGKKKADKRMTTSKLEINSTCVWDLKECSNFLKLIVAPRDNINVDAIMTDQEFHKFTWETTCIKIHQIQMAREHSKLKHSRVVFDAYLSCSELLYQQLQVESFEKIFNNFGIDYILPITEGFKNAGQVLSNAFYNKNEKFNSFLHSMTAKSATVGRRRNNNDDNENDAMLKEIVGSIQKVIEWIFEKEKKNAEYQFVSTTNGISILCNLFIAIEIFSNNFQNANYIREFFAWTLNIFKTTNFVKQKTLATCIIKLFLRSLTQHEDSSIVDCFAHKIATTYKYRSELNEPENSSQNNYMLITKHTVDEAFCEFIDFVKLHLSIVDVYIKRVNSFNAHAQRIKGQDKETISILQRLEIAISTKLIALGKSLERISSSHFPLQSSRHVEKLFVIVRAYYGSMTNLMKHFRKHFNVRNMANNESFNALQELVKYSRTFAKCIYNTIKYIDEETTNAVVVTSKEKKASKGNGSGSRDNNAVMKKTKKSIPKAIFMLENFHKSVTDFDHAAKTNLSRYLHSGEVRDFHISKEQIGSKSLMDDTISSSENENENEDDNQGKKKTNNPKGNAQKRKAQKSVISSSSSSSSPDDDDEDDGSSENELDDKDVPITMEKFEENLKKIVKAGRKGRKK